MSKTHQYTLSLTWTGNKGTGTSGYLHYSRNHEISTLGKPVIPSSSDPSFNGDNTRYNPEEMLVASLSSCHMLWYLHLCSVNGVVVIAYKDNPKGIMTEGKDGGGYFNQVILHPEVTITEESMRDKAISLQEEAHKRCFIASSVNFPVTTEVSIVIGNKN